MVARSAGVRPGTGRGLPIAVAALIVLALLPTRLTRPLTESLASLASVVVGPVKHPVHAMAMKLRGSSVEWPQDPAMAQLRDELEQVKAAYVRLVGEKQRLEDHLHELQRAQTITPDLPVRLIKAPVLGRSGNLSNSSLQVRAGRRDGVEPNAVAVVRGTQLVGQVQEGVQDRTCWVLPITDPRARRIEGVIMLGDLIRGPLCSLAPRGDGTLEGDVAWIEGLTEQPEVRPDMVVRVFDDTWPRHAQGLIVGRVEEVRPGRSPGRVRVVVRPLLPVDQVTEIVLRFIPESEPAAGETGAAR